MAIDLKNLVLSSLAILVLMPFALTFVSAKTYEVVSIGAIHEAAYSPGNYYMAVTPLCGTDVVNDTAKGILKFRVLPNPDTYAQALGASTYISDVSRPINNLPIFELLEDGDLVEIDFKNCQYSQISIERILSTNNYMIIDLRRNSMVGR